MRPHGHPVFNAAGARADHLKLSAIRPLFLWGDFFYAVPMFNDLVVGIHIKHVHRDPFRLSIIKRLKDVHEYLLPIGN